MYRYTEFAERYLNCGRLSGYTSVNIKVKCLFHDDHDPSMSFHLDKGQYFCFSCSASGGIYKLAKRLGLNVAASGYIEELDNIEAEASALLRRVHEAREAQDAPEPVFLPETALNRYLTDEPHPYWATRHLTPRTVRAWQLGHDPLSNAVTIPVRDPYNGKLVGITRRSLDPDVKPKYKDATGFKKGESLFGTWAPNQGERALWVLTEGPMDAIKVWQAGFNGRAILGARFTRDQAWILRRNGVEEVVLFFDSDQAGLKVAISSYGRLRRHMQVSVAMYRPDYPKDPGDMTSRQIKQAINDRAKLSGKD